MQAEKIKPIATQFTVGVYKAFWSPPLTRGGDRPMWSFDLGAVTHKATLSGAFRQEIVTAHSLSQLRLAIDRIKAQETEPVGLLVNPSPYAEVSPPTNFVRIFGNAIFHNCGPAWVLPAHLAPQWLDGNGMPTGRAKEYLLKVAAEKVARAD